MEHLHIDLTQLSEQDLSYLARVVEQFADKADMITSRTTRSATIKTPFIDVIQEIARQLITCAINFQYIPR